MPGTGATALRLVYSAALPEASVDPRGRDSAETLTPRDWREGRALLQPASRAGRLFGVTSLDLDRATARLSGQGRVSPAARAPWPWMLKTVFDRALALLAIVLLAPLLLTFFALIRLTSPGPALYRQTRVGLDGRPFAIYKFRTMHVNSVDRLRELYANERLLFKVTADPRLTRVGRWMRRYSFDELPQLVNVLKGDMSLVGPMPRMQCESAEATPGQVVELSVRPGLTGLPQIVGSPVDREGATALNEYYVRNWSLALDLTILARTVIAVTTRRGAY